MMKISKGEKTGFTGVLLTNKEYENYKNYLKVIGKFKTYKKDYDMTYKSYLL